MVCITITNLIFNGRNWSIGQVNAFGVFQAYYAVNQLSDNTASEISWIGSVQIVLLYISGLILGRVLDLYGARVGNEATTG